MWIVKGKNQSKFGLCGYYIEDYCYKLIDNLMFISQKLINNCKWLSAAGAESHF